MIRRLLAVAIVASGCGLKSPAPELHQYALAYPAPELRAEPLPAVVHVSLFDSDAIYNREAMVFREGEYEMGAYTTYRWMTTPPRMIGDLVTRDLVASGRYEAVVQGPAPLLSDYELTGHVERMDEEIGPTCEAVLQVRVMLVRQRPDLPTEPLLQRTHRVSEPCEAPGADAFVAAMSGAMERLSEALQDEVYAAIAEDLGRTAPEVAEGDTPASAAGAVVSTIDDR